MHLRFLIPFAALSLMSNVPPTSGFIIQCFSGPNCDGNAGAQKGSNTWICANTAGRQSCRIWGHQGRRIEVGGTDSGCSNRFECYGFIGAEGRCMNLRLAGFREYTGFKDAGPVAESGPACR
jgi:hypothetical protein